jgi:hypothetical protein
MDLDLALNCNSSSVWLFKLQLLADEKENIPTLFASPTGNHYKVAQSNAWYEAFSMLAWRAPFSSYQDA